MMKRLFLTCLVVIFVLFMQGGIFAHACQCMEMAIKKHSCCSEKQQEQQKSPCPYHQKTEKQATVNLTQSQACDCEMSSGGEPVVQSAESFPFEKQLVLVDVLTTDPFQDLRLTFTQKPTWLRRLYYPDKSALYLETSRLLI